MTIAETEYPVHIPPDILSETENDPYSQSQIAYGLFPEIYHRIHTVKR